PAALTALRPSPGGATGRPVRAPGGLCRTDRNLSAKRRPVRPRRVSPRPWPAGPDPTLTPTCQRSTASTAASPPASLAGHRAAGLATAASERRQCSVEFLASARVAETVAKWRTRPCEVHKGQYGKGLWRKASSPPWRTSVANSLPTPGLRPSKAARE